MFKMAGQIQCIPVLLVLGGQGRRTTEVERQSELQSKLLSLNMEGQGVMFFAGSLVTRSPLWAASDAPWKALGIRPCCPFPSPWMKLGA